MAHSCRRCNKKIPDGGLFYVVKLSAASGYDGIINRSLDVEEAGVLDEIAGRSSEDLEKDVYFEREVILCHTCRTAVIDLFCGEVGTGGDSDAPRNNLLH
jgi:hypothetical protein